MTRAALAENQMHTIRLSVFAVLMLCSSTGCAAFLNVADGADQKLPFGGTLIDGVALTLPIAALDDKPDKFNFENSCLIASMALMDLPFSIVGDVITLPYTVPVTFWRCCGKKPKLEETSVGSPPVPDDLPESDPVQPSGSDQF